MSCTNARLTLLKNASCSIINIGKNKHVRTIKCVIVVWSMLHQMQCGVHVLSLQVTCDSSVQVVSCGWCISRRTWARCISWLKEGEIKSFHFFLRGFEFLCVWALPICSSLWTDCDTVIPPQSKRSHIVAIQKARVSFISCAFDTQGWLVRTNLTNVVCNLSTAPANVMCFVLKRMNQLFVR